MRFGVGLAPAFAVALLAACAGSGPLRYPQQTEDTAVLSNLIARRVASDPRLCRYEITVTVYNQTARLEGKVSGDADRLRADQLAREAGALQVDDQLILDPATGDPERC